MAIGPNVTTYEKGLALAEQGRNEEALGCIREYLQSHPADGQAHNDAGAILYCLGRYDEAVKSLEKARDLHGDCAETLWNLAEVYLLNGQPAEAMALFDSMAGIGVLNADLLNRVAKEFLAHSDKADAIEVLLHSLRLSPNQEILEPIVEIIRCRRPKIAFFCCWPDDKFLRVIQEFAEQRFPIRLHNGQEIDQIKEMMEWSDISWFEWCDGFAVVASKLPKVCKMIIRLHRYEAYAPYPAEVNWDNIDTLITVGNSFVKNAIMQKVPDIESRTRVVTIPNGVELERFEFVDRYRGKNIACVGYLNMRKNPMFLLQCMQKLHYVDPEYRLFFAGEFQDESEQYVRHMVDALGLQDVVFFEGWQEDINAWLRDKHYIVSASIGESQGMGPLEGMACGLKPVIHNFPGAEEIFGPEFLFNIAEDFCRQILSETYEPQRYRGFVEQRYPLEKQLSSINEIFVEFERELPASSEAVQDICGSVPAFSSDAAAGNAGPTFSEPSLALPSLAPEGADKSGLRVCSGPAGTGFSTDNLSLGDVSSGTKRKVLVEFEAVIGDVLCMEPALRALKNQLGPDVEITVRTNHPELFTNHPTIKDVQDINLPATGGGYEQKLTLNWRATRQERGMHLVDRAATQMGVRVADRLVRMYLDGWDYVQLEKFNLPDTTSPKIVIGPSVRWSSRRWSDEKWRRLCQLLQEKFGATIIQLGDEHDEFLGCGIDLVGKTSVREAAAVISRCDLLISADNGLAHIAAAVDKACVVLFGPVRPETRMHAGPGRAVVSTGQCRGCLHKDDWDQTPPRDCPKGHHECMELISVESVLEAASQLLGQRTGAQK